MSHWYQEAQRTVTEVAGAVHSRSTVSLVRLEALASSLVAALQRNDELVVEALSGPPGSPLVTNLINVGILAVKIGIGLGYYGQELHRLAVAGLVHDIGLFVVPKSLVTKAGRLTHEERTLIEQHPELGSQVIVQCGPTYQWLAHLVRQAHERFDGQGYPNRLKGRQISEMALIVGVVDIFDALVSERPYRRRLLPHQAVKELLVAERTAFPREIQKALVEQLSVYPLGTTVRLTTGEIGIVDTINSRYPLRPIVKLEEPTGEDMARGGRIDLSRTPLISIVEALYPPMTSSTRFSDPSSESDSVPVIGSASGQFTSLLESLDAIASAIQRVVDDQPTVPCQLTGMDQLVPSKPESKSRHPSEYT